MSEAEKELSEIREYLLGGLEGRERERVEERVLTDAEYGNRVLLVEEDLIEEYADGDMDGPEREKFLKMFYTGPRRREVQVVEELRRQAAGVATEEARPTFSGVWLDRLRRFRRPAVVFALLALVTVIVFVARRASSPERAPGPLTDANPRRAVVERELARLNGRQGNRPQPPGAVAAVLSPGLSRGDRGQPAEEFPVVTLPRGAESARVRLLLRIPGQEYRSFLAALSPVGAKEPYEVWLTPVESGAGGVALDLSLPPRELDDGDYEVQLSVRLADGSLVPLPDHYFYFRLARQ